MPHFVGAGGHKKVLASWVGPAGSWKRVQARWIGVGGVWKPYFVAGTVTLVPATVHSFEYDPDVPESVLTFTTDGRLMASWTNQTVVTEEEVHKWFEPNSANAGAMYDIRATLIGGLNMVSGDTLGGWLPLNANRSWSVSGAAIYNRTRAATLEIAIRPHYTGEGAGPEPIAVAEYTLSTLTYSTTNPNGSYGRGGGTNVTSPYRFSQL